VRRCLTAEAQGHAHYAEGALRGSHPGLITRMAEKNPETWPAGREGSESVKFALRKTAAYCITPFL